MAEKTKKKDGAKNGKKKDGGKKDREKTGREGRGDQGTRGVALRPLLRAPAGERLDLDAFDPAATPGGPAGKAAGLAAGALLADPSPPSRSGCTRRARPGTGAACCSSCRAWTPAARAARSST